MRVTHVAQTSMLFCCLCVFGLLLSACDLSASSSGQATTVIVSTPQTSTATAKPPTAIPTKASTATATKVPTATPIPSCGTVSSGTKPLSTSHGAVTFDFVSGLITSGSAPQVSISVAASVITVTGINGVKLSEVVDILTCQQLHMVQYSETSVSGAANSAVLIAVKTQQGDLVFALITPQGGGDVGVQWTTYTP